MHKRITTPFNCNVHAICMFLGLLIGFSSLHAQTFSLKHSSEFYQDSAVAYLTPLEYAFMFHEQANWLLKANFLVTSDYNSSLKLTLSVEKTIAKSFSLNAVLFNFTNLNLGVSPDGRYNTGFESSMESRMYYQVFKNIRKNKPTTSLSGPYFALGAGYRATIFASSSLTAYTNPKFIAVFAKWGIQRRFLKRSYVDVGLTAGKNISLSGKEWSSLYFNTFLEAGFAFTRSKQKLNFDKLCPILRCHASDRMALKTNLINIINLAYIRKTFMGSINPNIAAEFKLGDSPFSINTKAASSFVTSSGNYHFGHFQYVAVRPQVTVETRYYYNLNNRILRGKTGNGLSANYVFVGPTYRGYFEKSKSNGYSKTQHNNFIGVIGGTGLQRLLTNHLYIDLNAGLGYGVSYDYDSNTGIRNKRSKTIFDVEIGIGYRF